MDIHFISSLTSEDEARCAEALLAVIIELLDRIPICYALRIEAVGTKVLEHRHVGQQTNAAISVDRSRFRALAEAFRHLVETQRSRLQDSGISPSTYAAMTNSVTS